VGGNKITAESKTKRLHAFDIINPHLTIFRVLKCEAITLLILTKILFDSDDNMCKSVQSFPVSLSAVIPFRVDRE
jgi:hypothetical protein